MSRLTLQHIGRFTYLWVSGVLRVAPYLCAFCHFPGLCSPQRWRDADCTRPQWANFFFANDLFFSLSMVAQRIKIWLGSLSPAKCTSMVRQRKWNEGRKVNSSLSHRHNINSMPQRWQQQKLYGDAGARKYNKFLLMSLGVYAAIYPRQFIKANNKREGKKKFVSKWRICVRKRDWNIEWRCETRKKVVQRRRWRRQRR